MDNFKTIYKILKYLESTMDFEEIDTEPIEPDALKITEERWASIMKMLIDNDYIDGIAVKAYIHQKTPMISGLENIKITLRGLEYLQDNSMMRKIANAAKGIKEIIPGA